MENFDPIELILFFGIANILMTLSLPIFFVVIAFMAKKRSTTMAGTLMIIGSILGLLATMFQLFTSYYLTKVISLDEISSVFYIIGGVSYICTLIFLIGLFLYIKERPL